MVDIFIQINEQKLLECFKQCDDSQKELLIKLYGKEVFAKAMDATKRIKTFEDACRELGDNHPFVQAWNSIYQGCEDWSKDSDIADVIAYHKLRIITAALNEGWQPQFTEDEWRWYPWFCLWSDEELSEKSDEWKQEHHLIDFGEYFQGEWAGFAYADSSYAPLDTSAYFGSRLCYKSEALADYSAHQFTALWADFYLIRKHQNN